MYNKLLKKVIFVLSITISPVTNAQTAVSLDSSTYYKFQQYLRQRLKATYVNDLDFDNAYALKFEDSNLFILRAPFKNKRIFSDFLILQFDSLKSFSNCNIVHTTVSNSANLNGDTVTIFSLEKNKSWKVFNLDSKTSKLNSLDNKPLNPVAIPILKTKDLHVRSYYLNVAALLHPEQIEKVNNGKGFGYKAIGVTHGGYGTYGFYFDINLDKNTILHQEITKIEFEEP